TRSIRKVVVRLVAAQRCLECLGRQVGGAHALQPSGGFIAKWSLRATGIRPGDRASERGRTTALHACIAASASPSCRHPAWPTPSPLDRAKRSSPGWTSRRPIPVPDVAGTQFEWEALNTWLNPQRPVLHRRPL